MTQIQHNTSKAGGQRETGVAKQTGKQLIRPAQEDAISNAGRSEPCPECGGLIVPESACWVCLCCGHSRCS